jgi:hypothetical protein
VFLRKRKSFGRSKFLGRGAKAASKNATSATMLPLSLPEIAFLTRKALKINNVEARGFEPLSSSLSAQTSTCLSGEIFEKPTLHRHTADSRASTNFLHRPARSLRRPISLLSTFGAVAGVQLQTSRSIKPRERDLGDLRLFVLARFLTRPTNHPRHAACASNNESKPVRPRAPNIRRPRLVGKVTLMARDCGPYRLSYKVRHENM